MALALWVFLQPRSGSNDLHPAELRLVEGIAAAAGLADIRQACTSFALEASGRSRRDPDFNSALATAMHNHLGKCCSEPAYVAWLDGYFGRRRMAFRSALQQPSFLYYPSLPAQAWFDSDMVPGLDLLRDAIIPVAAELRDFIGSAHVFQPYVGADAAKDAAWRGLSGSDAWSSIHLIKGGVVSEHLAGLPMAKGMLERAPLAQCPPHAPECFVSRLSPGVILPAHHGVSNIKLTVHLPLRLPPAACSITVGGETRGWMEGEFLVFDDSFLHSAQNLSGSNREVLIFDVWHPGLGPEERDGLAYTIAALDHVNRVAWAK